MDNSKYLKIIIVGGGFGGISAALALEKKKISNTKITLISDKPHFEYSPTLYRVLSGRSPLEVCIPLQEIFKKKKIEVLEDKIIEVNLREKMLRGESGSRYSFDFLILALGSETSFFNIPGLKEFSFSFKSINEALRLKRHLHEIFNFSEKSPQEEKVLSSHLILVGGGATGVELSGELAQYLKKIAKNHKLDPAFVTIDLIEAAPRILPSLPEDVSKKIEHRLRHLGVNIFLNRPVVKEDIEEIYLKDIKMKTKTVIWTAGVKTSSFYSKIEGLTFDRRGRVVVDDFLQAKGFENIFIIGDAASTLYSGMAQTAIGDGKYVAEFIARKIANKKIKPYQQKNPFYIIPVGPGWAALIINNFKLYGKLAWIIRRFVDFKFFLSILPLKKAILAFQRDKIISEFCPICAPKNNGKVDKFS